MHRIPLPPLALLLSLPLACGEQESGPRRAVDGATAEIATVPFADRGIETGDFALVSAGDDTIRFRVRRLENRPVVRLVRLRSGPAGTDSIAALVDAKTKEPIASYHRVFTADGDSLVARIVYGTGFEGQARLSLTTPRVSATENLRTPHPLLDAAQIPQTLSALAFGEPDTISVNYVAPFERGSLAARLVLGGLDTLRLEGEELPAWPVKLQVRGLEERYWFSATPDRYRLLRLEETTRGAVWTRVDATAPNPSDIR